MKYGKGMLSMWVDSLNRKARIASIKKYPFDLKLIVDFIKITEQNRRDEIERHIKLKQK